MSSFVISDPIIKIRGLFTDRKLKTKNRHKLYAHACSNSNLFFIRRYHANHKICYSAHNPFHENYIAKKTNGRHYLPQYQKHKACQQSPEACRFGSTFREEKRYDYDYAKRRSQGQANHDGAQNTGNAHG